MLKCIFPIVLLLGVVFDSSGQPSDEIVAKLNAYLNSANDAYKFNGVALVFHKNEVLLNEGYGFSNLSNKTLNGPETRFPILSITKTLTSTVILKLQEEGKLSVKDKIAKYLPDYPNGSKISIHHLLTHSSGIYNYTLDVGIEDSAIVNYPIAKETVVNHFKDKPLDFRPGKHYSYNNSGYFLLGLIIEQITGKPYEQVVRDYIFEPLKMDQSGFDFINLPKESKAQGYQFWNQKEAAPYKHYDSTFAYSAGSVHSTSTDLLKWAKAVYSQQILSPKTWNQAFQPKIRNYGYGWQSGLYFGKKYFKHSGGYPGYMSEFIYYPDDELVIVLLNNFGTYEQNVWSVGMGITSIVLGMPYDHWVMRNDVPVDVSRMKRLTGIYKNGKNQIEIKLVENSLFVAIPRSPDMRLLPENENHYFLDSFNTSFHFKNNELIVHEHGQDLHYSKQE